MSRSADIRNALTLARSLARRKYALGGAPDDEELRRIIQGSGSGLSDAQIAAIVSQMAQAPSGAAPSATPSAAPSATTPSSTSSATAPTSAATTPAASETSISAPNATTPGVSQAPSAAADKGSKDTGLPATTFTPSVSVPGVNVPAQTFTPTQTQAQTPSVNIGATAGIRAFAQQQAQAQAQASAKAAATAAQAYDTSTSSSNFGKSSDRAFGPQGQPANEGVGIITAPSVRSAMPNAPLAIDPDAPAPNASPMSQSGAQSFGTGPYGQYGQGDINAMAATLLGEARGEGKEGMMAVAGAIANRAAAGPRGYGNYGNTVQAQVSRPSQFLGYNQKAINMLNSRDPQTRALAEQAIAISKGIMSGEMNNPVGQRTEFRGPNAQGRMSPTTGKQNPQVVGRHVFFENPTAAKKLQDMGRAAATAAAKGQQAGESGQSYSGVSSLGGAGAIAPSASAGAPSPSAGVAGAAGGGGESGAGMGTDAGAGTAGGTTAGAPGGESAGACRSFGSAGRGWPLGSAGRSRAFCGSKIVRTHVWRSSLSICVCLCISVCSEVVSPKVGCICVNVRSLVALRGIVFVLRHGRDCQRRRGVCCAAIFTLRPLLLSL